MKGVDTTRMKDITMKTKKNNKEVFQPLTMCDDVSPMDIIINKKNMKKTSKYYKKKKKAMVEIITEYNNFFILPTFRFWFDKDFNGSIDKLFFEISWFNRTLAIKIK